MTQDMVGSKMKSQTGRGQNQDSGPVTIPHGRTRNRDKKHGIALAPIPNVSVPNVVLPDHRGADTLAGRVKGSPVDAHPSMGFRNSNQGSPSGTVPGNNRPVKK